MITFNPEGKDRLTNGESLGPAMQIEDPAEAQQYFDDYVRWLTPRIAANPSEHRGMTPEKIARSNLCYYAGYYSNETATRVSRLFSDLKARAVAAPVPVRRLRL